MGGETVAIGGVKLDPRIPQDVCAPILVRTGNGFYRAVSSGSGSGSLMVGG